MTDTVKSLIEYCRENNRVCPKPKVWLKLMSFLGSKEFPDPPSSLILGAWWATPALPKMLRLGEQIEWAAEHGILDRVSVFLRDLQEEDWHHIGE